MISREDETSRASETESVCTMFLHCIIANILLEIVILTQGCISLVKAL